MEEGVGKPPGPALDPYPGSAWHRRWGEARGGFLLSLSWELRTSQELEVWPGESDLTPG